MDFFLSMLPILLVTVFFVSLCCIGIYANLRRPTLVVQRDYRTRDKVTLD